LGFQVIKGSRKASLPILFDDKGKMHLVTGLDNIQTEDVPVPGTVTAYCESKNTGIEAYGMSDGTIWLLFKDGTKQKLIGHRSRISKMKLNGRRLFSSSYDGTVNLWITDNEKVEPMTLVETKNWIMHFNFDSTKNTFWMGDAKGSLTAVNISVPLMVENVKKKLKRDLTTEEWNYFIGQSIPYESFVK
jgi:WD40 repeat protein